MSKTEPETDLLSAAQTVFVVGYPKSGNTWLVRLLADALNIPVKSKGMQGALEIASGVNASLDHVNTSQLALCKMHYTPADLVNEIGCVPNRCVYIYRDFRDVVISAYFYFQRRHAEKGDFQYRKLTDCIARDPRAFLRYLWNRRRFESYVRAWCDDRKTARLPAQVTWKQHVHVWRSFLQEQTACATYTLSYESLLSNPLANLQALISDIDLPTPSTGRLLAAIQRQSFGTLKQKMENLSENESIPFGKEFNVKFLRKGTSGDWLNYMSPKLGRVIHEYTGDLLNELGYLDCSDWYERLVPRSLPSACAAGKPGRAAA